MLLTAPKTHAAYTDVDHDVVHVSRNAERSAETRAEKETRVCAHSVSVPAYGESLGPIMLADHLLMLTPLLSEIGPAEHCAGGSRCMSFNSF